MTVTGEATTSTETATTTEVAPAPLDFKPGDSVVISRGKNAGDPATVLATDAGKRQYALSLANGGFTAVSAASVRAPEEAYITASVLFDVLNAHFKTKVPAALVEALESAAPGITE